MEPELFPGHQICPYHGCYCFGFTSASDAKNHEMVMHPGQRLHRFHRIRTMNRTNMEPNFPSKFNCSRCPCKFSTQNAMERHCEAYRHESKAALAGRANKSARKGRTRTGSHRQKEAKTSWETSTKKAVLDR